MQTAGLLHKRVGSRGSFGVVGIVAISFVVALSLLFTFVLPRPYHVLENDYDNGFYYNARALYYGLPIHNVEHPGTPVILLEKLLMTSRSVQLDNTQSFLNQLYLVVGLVNCASIGLFCFFVLRRFSVGIAALALSSLAAWPPFLLQLNHYCSDSFILAFGLVALTAFWRILENFRRPQIGWLVLSGVACGLCLATKLSFLPFVLALELAIGVSVVQSCVRLKHKLIQLLVLGGMTAFTFALAILPVIHRLDEIVLHTLRRKDVRTRNGIGQAITENGWALLQQSPAFVVLLIAVVVALIVVVTRYFLLRQGEDSTSDQTIEEFDDRAGLVFAALLSGSLVYTIACAAPDLYSVGNSLRNASPSALVVPFSILLVSRISGKWPEVPGIALCKNRCMLIGALLVVVTSVTIHVVARQRWIQHSLKTIAQTETRLSELRQQYGRIAVWGVVGNQANFHFWANYRYAESVFDKELLAYFKGTTWLDLRGIGDMPVTARKQVTDVLSPDPSSMQRHDDALMQPWSRVLSWIHRRWLLLGQRRPIFPKRVSALYAGQNQGKAAGLLAFPESLAKSEVYARRGWDRRELQSWFENDLGPLRLWTEQIGGIEMVLLARQEKDSCYQNRGRM